MKKIYLLFIELTIFGIVFAQTASAALTNRYVVKTNTAAAAPYDSLANAAGDIQTAINYASTAAGSTVLVAAAIYDLGGTITAPLLTNRVYISKAITVRSIDNNPATTIIKGAWDPITTNGPAAVRCVYMIDGSSLIGFTLTNGATIRSNEVATPTSLGTSGNGGGVYAQSAQAVISNCIITGNVANGDPANSAKGGGGACNGTYFNCTFRGNFCRCYAGGAENAVLSNCTLSGNSAVVRGGGAFRGTLYGCLVSNNYATGDSGGIAGWSAADPCRLYGCTVITNTAPSGAGAGANTILSNCTVSFNVTGGVSGATLFNCSVVSNRSPGVSSCTMSGCFVQGNGTIYYGTWYNCLILGSWIYGNGGSVFRNCTLAGGSSFYTDPPSYIPLYNCISGSADFRVLATSSCGVAGANNNYADSAAGNITNNPMFLDSGTGNYRLRANSPCMNRGTNQAWMTGAVDLDGRTRIRYGTVDMGAYEKIYDGTIYGIR